VDIEAELCKFLAPFKPVSDKVREGISHNEAIFGIADTVLTKIPSERLGVVHSAERPRVPRVDQRQRRQGWLGKLCDDVANGKECLASRPGYVGGSDPPAACRWRSFPSAANSGIRKPAWQFAASDAYPWRADKIGRPSFRFRSVSMDRFVSPLPIYLPAGRPSRRLISRAWRAASRHGETVSRDHCSAWYRVGAETFTVANVVAELNRPVLVVSHNKSLAAQLYSELKGFFPENAASTSSVTHDYYQPEAVHIPRPTPTIAKRRLDSTRELEEAALGGHQFALQRRDCIVVASGPASMAWVPRRTSPPCRRMSASTASCVRDELLRRRRGNIQ
jgi:hypothetical protein